MNYNDFSAIWHEALSAAGLLPFPPRPTETIDVRGMSRKYSMIVLAHELRRARPFHVAAQLSWRWDALQSARTATTEEDLLIELLGQDAYDLVTQRPWLRVDVTLSATLPVDTPLPMPDAGSWQRWAREIEHRLAPLLPAELPDMQGGQGSDLLFWRSNPVARLQCGPDGQLYLTGVELPSWQGIELPRQWDNPDRPRDRGTEAQLASLCAWLRASLQVWEDCLQHLKSQEPDPGHR